MDVAALVRNVIRGYHLNQATVRLNGLVVNTNGEMKWQKRYKASQRSGRSLIHVEYW